VILNEKYVKIRIRRILTHGIHKPGFLRGNAMQREIYLDNSATTRQYDEVTDIMAETARNFYGNPSSLHTKGIEAERLVKASRESLAEFLDVNSNEIYFTSGGTESNNLAIRGYLEANPRKGRHIIATKTEHPSVLEVYKNLAASGFITDFINVDSNGQIDLDELKQKICEDTSLISIILVNNETGAIQPIEEIVNIKNDINRHASIHVDAVQAFGKIKLLPKKTGIELMSISSHKIHGPKGVGALYVSNSIKIKPVLFGGGQESLLRSGTENVPGIVGFGLAVERTFNNMETNLKHVAELKHCFVNKLKDSSFEYSVLSPAISSEYILNVAFKGLRAEVLLHHLEERKIYVSTGSACSSRKKVRSHVLTAMGIMPELVDGAVRFSFSTLNNLSDIEETMCALEDIVPRLQGNRKSKSGGK
jgi:cysteine desulfurase